MKKIYVALLALTLTACVAAVPKDQLKKYAFIRAGTTNFFLMTTFGPTVHITAIDGKPVTLDKGPIPVHPGTHTITMKCEGSSNSFKLDFKVGGIYEYALGEGPQGCFGELVRVN